MLHTLSIRNILLIQSLDLDFRTGLNVLTGETGAGKSILLDSLGFVLGWRGKADIVRSGADMGEVTAEFSLTPNHPVHALLTEAGFPDEDTLILRRINNSDGRKRAFANDRACSAEMLRQLSGHLVEIHGQHDDKGLLDAKAHCAMLDDFAGTAEDVLATARAWRDLAQARKSLKTAEAELAEASKDLDFLRHALEELDTLSPEVGEDETLDKRRRAMQAAGRIREGIAKAGAAVSLDGAEGMMSDAIRWLEDASAQADGHLEQPIEAMGRALAELADAQAGIEGALEYLQFDVQELEQVEERLFALRGLGRKHAVLPDALPALAQEFREKLDKIDTGSTHIAGLEQALKDAQKQYDKRADALSAKRHSAALRLDKAMGKELAPLKMERAKFITEITPAEHASSEGKDHVTFTVSTNPGSPSGPINKIASGGELSRFLLALKVCLSARSTDLTMIFDEIDQGVGGATANAVGRRLVSLAHNGQVLVVTHSPQVAALGAHHWMVSKSMDDDITTTDVRALDMAERTDEIARMLSGDKVTAEARAAAVTLLQSGDG